MTLTEGASNLLRAKATRGRPRKKAAKNGRSPFSARKVAIFLLLLLIILTGGVGFFAASTNGAIAAGVSIASQDVGGLTPADARAKLDKAVAGLRLTFEAQSLKAVIPVDMPVAADGRPLAAFDVAAAVKKAAAFGQDQDPLKAAAERLNAYLFGQDIKIPTVLDVPGLKQIIDDRFGKLAGPAESAALVVRAAAEGGQPFVGVKPESQGIAIDLDLVTKTTADRLGTLSAAPVPVRLVKDRPTLVAADVEPLLPAAAAAMERAALTLKAKDLTWDITQSQVADWLAAVPSGEFGSRAKLDLDRAKLEKYLNARTAKLAVEPIDAVFETTDGKVTKFSPGTDGEGVDVEASLALLRGALLADPPTGGAGTVELPFHQIPPRVSTEQSNAYGIKEIIGVGESNFKNSPKNRRVNIKVGADSVNGTLVMVDEEFSLIKTLGTIDETKGYLKELVIKKDKTQPEYGGGLCQIGTTTFRAALASGLPITERRNHSYRVPYYERDGAGKSMGPGKDATIYDPWPDFKFKNDTGHVILILTAIKGDRLTFTFWGVADGRKAEQTDAIVSNITPPPEKKTVETTDLKPGETKCTESPHAGADAVFTYTVTYAGGEVKKQNFYSHYKPWGEVCLIGIDPNDKPASDTPALPSADVVGATGQ